MLRRVVIARHERGFVFRGEDYLRFLPPGAHWLWGLGLRVVRASTHTAALTIPELDRVLTDPQVAKELHVVELAEDERALVWVDDRLEEVLDRRRAAYWREPAHVQVERRTTDPLRLQHRRLGAILASPHAPQALREIAVPAGHRGLLYVDGELREDLAPGRYAFWNRAAQLRVSLHDVREQTLEISGQEILSRDKVSLRINLTATYALRDVRLAEAKTANVGAALYRDAQLSLREAVGTRTLDELLASKQEVGQEVFEAVAPRARSLGAELGAMGLRDVILPGDMKTLLNQVIEAEKRAQANLVVRREETAATRSLLNTAKLIESSPTLLRLKELEAAERISASIGSIQVVGGVDALVQQLVPKR